MTTTLSFREVSMTYRGSRREHTALEHVSLDIVAGEIVCLLGPSGCGKTTLLNLGAGLIMPTAGTVTFEGQPVQGPDPARGMIFQQYALFPWMTVEQNAQYGLRLKRVPRRERAEIARRYLALVGLEDFADALPKELSGGMKQRVAIARAYAVQPHMLFMDEPFGALDAMTRWRLIEDLVATWQQTQVTIAFVTHDVDEAIVLGHRIVVMASSPGRIVDIVDVPAPHPRGESFRATPEFSQIRNRLWKLVYRDKQEITA